MTKHARKAGNIIFVLVISFLLIMGCLFASDTIKDKTDNTNLDNMAKDVQTTADVTYTLPGSYSENARIWNEAIDYALANTSSNVLVKLNGNWTATTHATFGTTFGGGSGFSNGRIYVPKKANVILDINGKTINRNLTSSNANGSVIYVHGNLRIIDSGFVSNTIYDLDDAMALNLKSGQITGGYSTYGGGIYIDGGKFYMYQSAIFANKATDAAGVFVTNSGEVNIYDGIILKNIASRTGGGICSLNSSKINVYGGHIFQNTATHSGGGIYGYEECIRIYGGKISYNKAGFAGGGVGLANSANSIKKAIINNCIFSHNKAYSGTTVKAIGGAIDANTATVDLDGVEIKNNEADSGSAIGNVSNKITLKNCTITNNKATTSDGYAVQLHDYAENGAYLSCGNNVIILDNRSSSGIVEKNVWIEIYRHDIELFEYAPGSRINISTEPYSNSNPVEFLSFYNIHDSKNNAKTIISIFNNASDYFNGSTIQAYSPGQSYRFIGENTIANAVWRVKSGDGGVNYYDATNYIEVPYTGYDYEIDFCSRTDYEPINCQMYSAYFGEEASGGTYGRSAGVYVVTADIQLDNNIYTNRGTFTLRIVPKVMPTMKWGTDTCVYDAQFHKVSLTLSYDGRYYDTNIQTLLGGTNVGTGINFTDGIIKSSTGRVDSNYRMPLWNRVKTFTITPRYLDRPTIKSGTGSTFTYDGTQHQLQLNNYNTTYLTGLQSYTDAGWHETKISIKSPGNCYWKTTTGSSSGTDTADITFMMEILLKPIEKPILGDNEFIYTGQEITFLPDGFDASQMEITGNKNTDVGEYTAKVTPNSNYKWSDNTTTAIEFKYRIFPPGVVVKDGVKYDYLYIDSNNIRQFYGNSYMHKLNDENLNIVNGVSKYVLGNIPVNTSIEVFLNNLQSDRNLIKIYAKESDITPIYDGLIGKRSDLSQTLATGFKVELYSNSTDTTPFDTIYLSVLGDINGDGRINASDVSYLRQVANDSTLLESMPLERQLACMINNKGGITEVDSEILRNYIGKEIDLEKFMESETANTNNTYTYLTLDRDNMLRKVSESKTNVIGNISVNTSVETLKSKLAEIGINISAITIYNRKGDEVSNNTAIVGTGWRIEVGGEVTYLSVLGDLTGDGRITAADISYLRAIAASDTTNVQDCILLSAILLNKGGITTADSEVLKLVINNKISIDKY